MNIYNRLSTARTLRKAESLSKQGEWVNAIEHLAASNRQHENKLLERAMIDLLLRACAESDTLQSRQSPQATRPLPGNSHQFSNGNIPEISAEELSAPLLRKAISESGYLIVRNYMDVGNANIIRKCIDESLQARARASEASMIQAPAGPWYYPSQHFPGNHSAYSERNSEKKYSTTGSFKVVDSPRGSFRVMEIYRQLGLEELLADYFGEPAVIATRKWVFRLVTPRKNVRDGVGGGWHQDGQFMGKGIRALNMWVALSECGEGTTAPGIALLPKRMTEVLEYGTGGANLNWVVGREIVQKLAQDAPVVNPHFEGGDALFFDHLSLHRSGHSPGQIDNRYALESWFYAGSAHSDNSVLPCI